MGASYFEKVFHASSIGQFKRQWRAWAAWHRRELIRRYCNPGSLDYVQAVKDVFRAYRHQQQQQQQQHAHESKPVPAPPVPPVPAKQILLLAEQYGVETASVKYNKQYFEVVSRRSDNQLVQANTVSDPDVTWQLVDLDLDIVNEYLMYNGGPSQWSFKDAHARRRQQLALCRPTNTCHNTKYPRPMTPTKQRHIFDVHLPAPGSHLTYSVSLAYVGIEFTDKQTLTDFADRLADKWTYGYVFRLFTNNTTKFVVYGVQAE
jgi:hypothetical protein